MRVLRYGMRGADVAEAQAALRKAGYYQGPADGIFGLATLQAVEEFQIAFGLSPDGIIGTNTYAAMEPFLIGYGKYTVKQGDTLYKISGRYGTDIELILTANPDIDPNKLTIGQRITVPYGFNIVDTDIPYTYEVLERDIEGLKARYPFLETGIIGKSALGRNLSYIRLGTGNNKVFYTAAIHALEWITSPVLMKFAEDFLKAYTLGKTLSGRDVREIWNNSSIYILPMANPDGIELVINGLSRSNPNYYKLISWNGGSADFSQDWESNNNGVDLNHNFNAAWEESVYAAEAMGITGPGPTRYPGPYPESEPESRSMANFTRTHDFRLVLAYHSQGEVIYWNFMNLAPPEARPIGEALARESGYQLEVAAGISSTGGYKDWFIQTYRRPGYTVEVGLGKNPLPISQFSSIYASNLPLLLTAAVI